MSPYSRADDVAMDTFDVRLPRWPVLLQLFGRDPLVRNTDRAEALVLVLVIVISLLTIPIAAAIGTAVHDSNRRAYAEQALNRQAVTATVIDVPAARHESPTGAIDVAARWTVGGAHHTGVVTAQSTVKSGDAIAIWIAGNGDQVPAPTPTTRAAVEATLSGFAIWMSAVATAATLYTLARAACDRIRSSGWEQDLNNMLGYGDR
jgi:hypothetical protein